MTVNKKTKKKETLFMTIKEMEEYLKKNPDIDILPGKPLIHTGFLRGESKSDGWNDLLKKIKKTNPRSNIKLTK